VNEKYWFDHTVKQDIDTFCSKVRAAAHEPGIMRFHRCRLATHRRATTVAAARF